ncbi:50S ribosomal protein L4 [Patescibacteria group bacterium]|nr:50S ribosomal protein L4 [Patescibacteria group bacterium]MBU2632920.1 50S ribosomal protein L4 [Patescibacteria group bacterium]
MELKTYNQNGEEVGKIKLPDKIFGLPWNEDLIYQVIVSMQSNKRAGTAHAKTRAEVSGGGAKPWRQKGTGRARHGSRRSPIWIGGGVTHGPLKEKNYDKKINKKMKQKALFVSLSQKVRDGEMLVLDDIKISAPKTKEANVIVSSLGGIKGFEKIKTKRKNRALFLTNTKNDKILRSFNNLPGVAVEESRNLNPLSVLTYKYLIFSKKSLDFFSKKEE